VAIDAIRLRLLTSILFASLSVGAGCGAPDFADRTEEEPPQPATEVQVADPRASPQLISGWYNVEHNAWRWTAGEFAVRLRPPIGAAVRGAALTLHFTLPDVVISQLGSVTLSASVGGVQLASQTYGNAGSALYTCDLPASVFSGQTVRIDFHLDKVMVPGHGDTRQLGIVADRVGLEGKPMPSGGNAPN
jgi:hypothetical protein